MLVRKDCIHFIGQSGSDRPAVFPGQVRSESSQKATVHSDMLTTEHTYKLREGAWGMSAKVVAGRWWYGRSYEKWLYKTPVGYGKLDTTTAATLKEAGRLSKAGGGKA